MPNEWNHNRPNAESTCIGPDIAPYGRWNVDEIIYAAIPSLFLITAWRMIFCHILGPYLGGYIARRETPNPHPKPSFVVSSAESDAVRIAKLEGHWKRVALRKSKIPKKQKKEEEDAQKQQAEKLANKIQRRVEALDGTKKKRKRLILPKGLSPNQSPENLAFLASLDSDATRIEIPGIMKELDYSLCDVRAYFEWRRDQTTIRGMTQKFNEEAWKGLTMLCITIYGIWVMGHEPFFGDPSLNYKEWPQIESWRVFLYYQIAVGYHVHRAIWQFWDKKRSDIIAMFIHHWVTVMLVGASWYWGLMNIGSVVMVAHDNSDIFLPLAKLGRWARCNMIKNVGFVLFICSWIISRIGLFTWKVIIPVFRYAPTAYSCHYGKFLCFACGLLVLLCLHIFWMYTIFSVAFQWICFGVSVEDTRSDEEDGEEFIILPEEFSDEDSSTQISIDGASTTEQIKAA